MALTPKQERFIQEYLVDSNGAQAVIRAGYSEKNANREAYQLLENEEIAAAVAVGRAELAEKSRLMAMDNIAKLVAIADLDPAALVGPDGKPLPIEKVPQSTRKAIASMKVREDKHGNITTEYRFEPRIPAIELIGQFLSMWKRTPVSIDVTSGGQPIGSDRSITGVSIDDVNAVRELLGIAGGAGTASTLPENGVEQPVDSGASSPTN